MEGGRKGGVLLTIWVCKVRHSGQAGSGLKKWVGSSVKTPIYIPASAVRASTTSVVFLNFTIYPLKNYIMSLKCKEIISLSEFAVLIVLGVLFCA